MKSQCRDKIKAIANLTADELAGWVGALGRYRQPLEGEQAAIFARAKALGVDPETGRKPAAARRRK